MRKTNRFTTWLMALMCLLVWLCTAQPKPANAQTGQPPVENIPGIPAGYTIIDGDIQVPISVANAMRQQGQENLSPNSPQAVFNTNLWPNGIVPFEFELNCEPTSGCATALPSGCVGLGRIGAMLDAMKVLKDVANVNFRQCPNNKCSGNYIHIRDTTNDTVVAAGGGNVCQSTAGNNSAVGMQSGQQTLNMASWGSKFIIVHELLHALGVLHEHSRPDRNNFISIITGNIQPASANQLALLPGSTPIYGPYDFDSVMHYDRCSFSTGCAAGSTCNCTVSQETIQVKAPFAAQWQSLIGQRNHLSYLDAVTISFLYPRGDFRFVDATNAARRQFGTFLDPYSSLAVGINATPLRGTLWIQPGTYRDVRLLSKPMTLRAPIGGVTIQPINGGIAGGSVVAAVSAASYNGELSAESIVAAFGENLAASTAIATTLPLPTTLGGVTLKVTDSADIQRNAPLFFVSSGQINYQVPAGTSAGIAKLGVYNGDKLVATGTIPIVAASPGLFSANASGQGVPAASLLRVRGDGQFYEPVARYDGQLQQFVPVPIDLGPEGDQVFLILFGTGFRAAGTAGVTVTIGDEEAEVLYAGVAPGFAGLDQANVRVPRSLVGKGEVTIQLTADNRSANGVTVNIK